ncbi:hypothetical protein E2493_09790 [Sphingomonas parva]|uniref:Uncharacterized protein n=1 Tax=Sphingomonas parva TaxID=2555898 RepID=A0A4Y8ZSF4_9SPHN|nr:hypothetical protein [Sphingomonas parva]TFI58417.1 hypothetical protein E2493_09790 [Sphingomonas parva]
MRFKNLDRYRTGGAANQMHLSLPVPKTPDGRVYRFSPNENAHPRHFVLGDPERPEDISDDKRARMKLEPGSSQTVCPYSGVIADDDEFIHPDDREAAIAMVKDAAVREVEDALTSMFEGLNRRTPRKSLVSIEAKVRNNPRPRLRFYRDDLLRELICDHCGRDYGVYAIGLFCPDCGAPNLRLHFAREVELVDAQVQLADGLEPDLQELAYRLLGNAHEDVLTAFEATLKTVYLFGREAAFPGDPVANIGNAFQNVERGQKQFAELGFNPFDVLEDEELAALKLNIQKRHVIGHNLGVIDAKFADLSGEAGIGETVHLVGEDTRAFAIIAQKVVDGIDGWLGGVAIPPRVREAPPPGEETEVTKTPAADLRLSELGYRLGAWLAGASERGLNGRINADAVLSAFSDVPIRDLQDAVAELEMDGYISATTVSGRSLPLMGYRLELFSTFDPLTRKTDPTLDAAILAALALDFDGNVNVAELHAKSGWDHRQFNPALGVLVSRLDERRVSKTHDAEYPTRMFILGPQERVELKRFKERHPPSTR